MTLIPPTPPQFHIDPTEAWNFCLHVKSNQGQKRQRKMQQLGSVHTVPGKVVRAIWFFISPDFLDVASGILKSMGHTVGFITDLKLTLSEQDYLKLENCLRAVNPRACTIVHQCAGRCFTKHELQNTGGAQ